MTLPIDNHRAPDGPLWTWPDPQPSTPGNAKPAKLPTIQPADVRPWVEGTGVGPTVTRFEQDAPKPPDHPPAQSTDDTGK
jgi:hypothetical protein